MAPRRGRGIRFARAPMPTREERCATRRERQVDPVAAGSTSWGGRERALACPFPLVLALRAPVERGRRLVRLPRLPQVIVRAAVAALAAPDLVVDGPDLHLELGGVLDHADVAELVDAPVVVAALHDNLARLVRLRPAALGAREALARHGLEEDLVLRAGQHRRPITAR